MPILKIYISWALTHPIEYALCKCFGHCLVFDFFGLFIDVEICLSSRHQNMHNFEIWTIFKMILLPVRYRFIAYFTYLPPNPQSKRRIQRRTISSFVTNVGHPITNFTCMYIFKPQLPLPLTEQKKDKIIGFSIGVQSGTNVVGLVVFSVTLGIIVGRMGEEGLPVRRFVDSLQQAILQIVTLVIC